MKDALGSKLAVIATAATAFVLGVGATAALDLTPSTVAAGSSGQAATLAGQGPLLDRETLSFESGFAPIVDRISGAVVTIFVQKPAQRLRGRFPRDFFPFPFPRGEEEEEPSRPRLEEGSGSGFIVSRDGYIVTNNHVVEGAESIRVQLADRREFENVEVVGRDPQTDVALLRIEADDLETVPLGESDSLRVGEWVLAIGSPGFDAGATLLPSTVTAGIVSAKGRSIGILNARLQQQGLPNLAIENFIQTDAVINRGNSGGPLVNMSGEVVGMSTAIISETGNYQGYGFAVPTRLIRQVVDDLMRYGEVRRAVLGVIIEDVQPTTARYFGLDAVRGVQIVDFSPLAGGMSPARAAGIEPGDIVLSVDGKPVQSVADLQTLIRTYDPGETVRLGVARREGDETRRLSLGVELASADTGESTREQQTAQAGSERPLGIEVRDLRPSERDELNLPEEVDGVLVVEADEQSPLVRAAPGWSRFTIVTEIDGEEVGSAEEYRRLVSELEPGSITRFQLYFADPRGESGRRGFATFEVPGG